MDSSPDRGNRAWKIFGAVDNLTNVRYEDFLGFRAPGTWVRFGVEGNWE